jgi:outer membrane protein, heavy metal efflux system
MPVFAQESASLSSLITRAKDKNPEIIAARESWKAAKAGVLRERSWENPMFSIDYQNMPLNDFNTGKANETWYEVQQAVPFPGKLSIKGKLASLGAEKAGWDYRETELGVIARLKAAYAKYFYIGKTIGIYEENIGLMKDFASAAEKKYVSGGATQGEVLRAQIESLKMQNMLINLRQEKETAAAEINALLGSGPDEKIGEPEELTPVYVKSGWDRIKALIDENNPRINMEKVNVSMAAWSSRYARTGFLPDLDLTYRKRQTAGNWTGQDFMIGFTLPIWLWSPISGARESALGLKSSAAGQKNTELMTVYAGKEIFVRLQTLERQIELYRTTFIPQAEQSFKVTGSLYRSGKEDFLMLLESERALLDFQLDYYKTLAEYFQNRADLEKAAGVEVE